MADVSSEVAKPPAGVCEKCPLRQMRTPQSAEAARAENTRVCEAVLEAYNVSLPEHKPRYRPVQFNDLFSRRRTERIALPRQIAMYVLVEHLHRSLSQVSQYLRRKEHTTVMHGRNKVQKKLKANNPFVYRVVTDALRILGLPPLAPLS